MTPQKVWRSAAIFFAVLGAFTSLLLFRLKWIPPLDFDILGVAWLIMNAAPLGVIAIVTFCFGAATYFWIRSFLA